MLKALQRWLRRRTYREGRQLSRFIAMDVRRDVLIVSVARLDQGFITARVRTLNVLYLANKLVEEPEFEPEREILIQDLWHWTGQPWGGLPDGTSIADPSPQKGAT